MSPTHRCGEVELEVTIQRAVDAGLGFERTYRVEGRVEDANYVQDGVLAPLEFRDSPESPEALLAAAKAGLCFLSHDHPDVTRALAWVRVVRGWDYNVVAIKEAA